MQSAEGTEEFLQAIMGAHCPGEGDLILLREAGAADSGFTSTNPSCPAAEITDVGSAGTVHGDPPCTDRMTHGLGHTVLTRAATHRTVGQRLHRRLDSNRHPGRHHILRGLLDLLGDRLPRQRGRPGGDRRRGGLVRGRALLGLGRRGLGARPE